MTKIIVYNSKNLQKKSFGLEMTLVPKIHPNIRRRIVPNTHTRLCWSFYGYHEQLVKSVGTPAKFGFMLQNLQSMYEIQYFDGKYEMV